MKPREKNYNERILPLDPENSDAEDSNSEDPGDSDSSQEDLDNVIVESIQDWSLDTHLVETNHDFEQNPRANIFSASKKNVEKFFFHQILSENFLELMANQTNLYSRQKNEKLTNWNDTCVEELQALIGILIIMGIHQMPRIENYWSTDRMLRVDQVASIMTSKHFMKLLEMIHIADNWNILPRDHPEYDKLHKVRPLLDHINSNCARCYSPSKTVSVDESMIPFAGRSALKQFMPQKPIRKGYKNWCLADSETGFIIKSEMYCGKINQ